MDVKFHFIGWCNKTVGGIDHDKVWTAFSVGERYYAGWGRRGKSLSFKEHPSLYSLMSVKRQKQREYNEVDAFQLFTIFPYFEEEVEKRLFYCVLANKVK